MPKIPTFTTQARPTAEVGAVKSSLQISPTETLGAALTPAAKQLSDFYIKEKEISNKVEAGKLLGNATQEIYELQEQSKLKSTPDEGINFFNEGYKNIINRYKQQAGNDFISKYFEINLNSNKPSYVSNVLKQTRSNMVSARVNQVTNRVQNKILNAVENENDFDFNTLANSVVSDYQGLVDDGLIGELDLQAYKTNLPKLVEIQQVKKIARNDAYAAVLALDDPKNFTQITGEDRDNLISELQTKATFQSKRIELFNNSKINENDKNLINELKIRNNNVLGLDEESLQKFKIGDLEYDNQITKLNDKIVNNKFNYNTNYNINSSIIEKISRNEIKNAKEKFLLPGENEPKSIIERTGDGSLNLDDNNFLATFLTRSNNEVFKKQDKQFFKYFENLTPLLEGNNFLKFFDKEYNSKASTLRQELYSRYIKGLSQNITIENLLTSTSENYIAKDIKNFLPKTSDLSSIVEDIIKENKIDEITIPQKLPGETAEQYLERTGMKKKSKEFESLVIETGEFGEGGA